MANRWQFTMVRAALGGLLGGSFARAVMADSPFVAICETALVVLAAVAIGCSYRLHVGR